VSLEDNGGSPSESTGGGGKFRGQRGESLEVYGEANFGGKGRGEMLEANRGVVKEMNHDLKG